MTIDAKELDAKLARGEISYRQGIEALAANSISETTAKLTLALAAVEAAKGIVAQIFFPHDEPGVKFCTCCHRPVRDDGKLTHKGNCEVEEFQELVTQLEQSQ